MSGRLGDYPELVRKAQARRLQITRQQQREIARLYKACADDLAREAAKRGTASLSYRWLTDYAKSLRRASKAMFAAIRDTTLHNMQDVAEVVTGAERRFYTAACPVLSERFRDVFSRVPRQVVDELTGSGVYEDFAGLSTRIWDYRRKYDHDIQTVIRRGIAQQMSAPDLAQDLQLYLRPRAAKPWDWGRVYPGVNRAVDYNTQRLARTAITHTYQMTLTRATQDNPFVGAYSWHSSNGARTCEICRERDGRLYPKGAVPLDHPNGMCAITAEIADSYDEIGARLGDWAAGNPDAALDKWLGGVSG